MDDQKKTATKRERPEQQQGQARHKSADGVQHTHLENFANSDFGNSSVAEKQAKVLIAAEGSYLQTVLGLSYPEMAARCWASVVMISLRANVGAQHQKAAES